jgi:predicted nucleic acid-binding protein
MNKIALDTNILIYGHDKNDMRKQDISRTLLDLSPVISTQAVSEYINVLRRKIAIPKHVLIDLCMEILDSCVIHPVSISTLKIARHIIQRYDLQIFDSIIIASAVEGDCKILYSEDMQHGLEIDGGLKILNPFL